MASTAPTAAAAAAEWADLLAPFVNAKLVRPARKVAVDILGGGAERIDADIRGVTAQGVERFFYSGVELIPWADIRLIRLRSLDAMGDTTACREWAA